jgi:hypothetical protein
VKILRNEPARVIAFVLALIGLASAFGLHLSDDQSAAIVAAVSAVLALIGGEAIRAQVSPVVGGEPQGDQDPEAG